MLFNILFWLFHAALSSAAPMLKILLLLDTNMQDFPVHCPEMFRWHKNPRDVPDTHRCLHTRPRKCHFFRVCFVVNIAKILAIAHWTASLSAWQRKFCRSFSLKDKRTPNTKALGKQIWYIFFYVCTPDARSRWSLIYATHVQLCSQHDGVPTV